MLSLIEHMQLDEMLVKFSGGAKYGQAVFLAGGGGSGKGYAIEKFIEGENFRTIDVDYYKQQLIKMGKNGKPGYEKFANLDLRNPNDVFNLHQMVKQMGLRDKVLNAFFDSAKTDGKDRLPNILFDTTMKDMGDLNEVIPRLVKSGYDPSNIHLVWVLTNFHQAAANNRKRSRVVPDDVLLATHEGAAKTFMHVIGGHLPEQLNGKIVLIINNQETQKPFNRLSQGGSFGDWQKHQEPRKPQSVPDKFKYIILKKEGEPLMMSRNMMGHLEKHVRANIPRTAATRHLWPDRSLERKKVSD